MIGCEERVGVYEEYERDLQSSLSGKTTGEVSWDLYGQISRTHIKDLVC